jgi:hypothetical protein
MHLYLPIYILLFIIYHKLCPLNFYSKYFFAHVLHNIGVIIYTIPIIKNILDFPLQEDLYIYTPSHICSLLGALHIYHLIYYKVTFDEAFHHICAIYFHFFPANKFLLANLFFMSGLPGGITYFLLILVKYNLIDSITEKKISTYLNLWCRMPGILFFSSILLINMYHNKFNIQDYITFTFMVWNAIHFMKTIFISYLSKKLSK